MYSYHVHVHPAHPLSTWRDEALENTRDQRPHNSSDLVIARFDLTANSHQSLGSALLLLLREVSVCNFVTGIAEGMLFVLLVLREVLRMEVLFAF